MARLIFNPDEVEAVLEYVKLTLESGGTQIKFGVTIDQEGAQQILDQTKPDRELSLTFPGMRSSHNG